MTNLLLREEVAWKQRSRARWIKEGCRNSRLFHSWASHHRRYNYIEELEINGEVVKGNMDLREGVKTMRSCMQVMPSRSTLDGLNFNRLFEQGFHREGNICIGLMSCKGDKVLRLDNFDVQFFQDNWGAIKANLIFA